MACNCGKRNPDGTRKVRQGAPIPQPSMREQSFVAISPQGDEHEFPTLREARAFGSKSPGGGWRIEGRRG